jgi:hypothetical protein
VIQKSWGNGIPVFLAVFVFIPDLNCCIDNGAAKRGFHVSFIEVARAMVLEYLCGILECPSQILKKDFEVHGIVKSTDDSWGRFCCHSLEDLHIQRRDGIAKVIGTVICIGGAVLMSLYKGEVLLVPSNMQPEVDDAVIIQPFTSLTMCLGTSVASMSISKFQLGCIFLVLNSVLWAVYLNLQVKDLLCFSIISLSQVPIHAFFPPPLPLPPLSVLYRLTAV